MTTIAPESKIERVGELGNSAKTEPQIGPRLKTLFQIIAWQVMAIFFVEFALATAGLGEEEIFALDAELGSRHMVNKRVTWRSEGYAQSYFGLDGLREQKVTLEKRPGIYRVALLGDSLTEGLQVPYEQSFGALINKKSNGVEVLNFGVSGYSTAQEYIQLKKQVLKYKPDLVLVCYNSRDIFENWSPPDEVLTNVRPYALHLPGGKLVVDNSPVTLWMRSPRAKFMRSIEWVREHSRLWGLWSALEMDLSLHNNSYKEFVKFLTKPGKTLTLWTKNLKESIAKSPNPQPTSTAKVIPQNLAKPAPVEEPKQAAPDGRKTYKELVMRTEGSLLSAMQEELNVFGGRLALVALPVRSALCPSPGQDKAFLNYSYEQEVEMLETICQEKKVPFLNCLKKAEALTKPERERLYYAVHYSPYGQEFVSSCLYPFVAELSKGRLKHVNAH